MLPGVPARSVTVTVFDCGKNSTDAVSLALAFGFFTDSYVVTHDP